MKPIKYCPKCGYIDAFENLNECVYCGTPYKSTKYDANHCINNNSIIPEVKKAIEDEYVLESPMLSQDSILKRLSQERMKKDATINDQSNNNIYIELLEIKLNQQKILQQTNYLKSINAKLTFFTVLVAGSLVVALVSFVSQITR